MALTTENLSIVGVPTLALEGDSWNRRTTPMSVLTGRIDEFIDNVVAKKRRRAPRSVIE